MEDLNFLKNPSLDWIFGRNLRQTIDVKNVVNSLFENKCVKAIAYQGEQPKISENLSDPDRDLIKKEYYNLLKENNALMSPSSIKKDFFAFLFLDTYEIIISHPKEVLKNKNLPTVSSLTCDIHLSLFKNGILTIIFKFKEIEKIINCFGTEYLFSWWTEYSYEKRIEIKTIKDPDFQDFINKRFININEKNEDLSIKFNGLNEYCIHLTNQIRKICKLEREETTYNLGINHPLLHFSLNRDTEPLDPDQVQYEVSKKLIGKYHKQITKLISKSRTNQRSSEKSINDISTLNNLLLFSDFNSLAIHLEDSYLDSLNYIHLYLLMNYIQIIRNSMFVTDNEIDVLIHKKLNKNSLDQLSLLQHRWLQNFNLITPFRSLRMPNHHELIYSWFEIFSIKKFLESIDQRFEKQRDLLTNYNLNSERFSLNIINFLLAGSLAFDITRDFFFSIFDPDPMYYFIIWAFIGLIFYLVLNVGTNRVYRSVNKKAKYLEKK